MTQARRLGQSDLTTVPLILGGNVFGWTADEATSFAVLDAFVAGGGTAFERGRLKAVKGGGAQASE